MNVPGADPMAADYVFSFTTGADTAPVVASTQPVAGAGAVATTANVVVNFSEPVSVAGAWYAISCTVSNAHTAVVTGGPTSYTLNPDVDFQNSESCTVTTSGGPSFGGTAGIGACTRSTGAT